MNGTYYGVEFRRVVLIMQGSFCRWYLLWTAVSKRGTYSRRYVPPNGARIDTKMVLIRYLLNGSMVLIMDSNAIRNRPCRCVSAAPVEAQDCPGRKQNQKLSSGIQSSGNIIKNCRVGLIP